MKTDGIIFDMDGTLWDTCKIVADSWTAALRDAGVEKVFSVEMIRSCMGLMMEEFAAKCMPEIETAQRLFYLKKCFEYENKYLRQHGGLLFSGVTETLAALKEKYPLFIVSNCQDGYIEAFFAGNDTGHFFKDYENPGRTGLSKDGNIRLICGRNDLKSPVYVGDTKGDMDACKKAGVSFIYAAYGFGDVTEGYDARIENFTELRQMFL